MRKRSSKDKQDQHNYLQQTLLVKTRVGSHLPGRGGLSAVNPCTLPMPLGIALVQKVTTHSDPWLQPGGQISGRAHHSRQNECSAERRSGWFVTSAVRLFRALHYANTAHISVSGLMERCGFLPSKGRRWFGMNSPCCGEWEGEEVVPHRR